MTCSTTTKHMYIQYVNRLLSKAHIYMNNPMSNCGKAHDGYRPSALTVATAMAQLILF